MISVKAPARICFYGDHQDYLGLPVIAGAINRFIYVTAEKNSKKTFEINLKDLDESISISLEGELKNIQNGDYLRSVMAVLRQKGFQFEQGYDIEIQGNIPLNAGLSSSSALVVAWIRFLVTSQSSGVKVTDEQIGRWAYESEVMYFNQPGGLMDQYTIAQGGLLYIDTKSGQTEKLKRNLGKLVVAESGIKKQTLDVLKNGRLYQERAIGEVKAQHPEFEIQNATPLDYEKYKNVVPEQYQAYWHAAIFNHHTTKKAKLLLSQTETNILELSYLMNQHQAILENQIGNTPAKMKKMMSAARNAGALAAKTIGSGGGGCMVAMVNERTKSIVIEAFLKAGAKAAYEVELV